QELEEENAQLRIGRLGPDPSLQCRERLVDGALPQKVSRVQRGHPTSKIFVEQRSLVLRDVVLDLYRAALLRARLVLRLIGVGKLPEVQREGLLDLIGAAHSARYYGGDDDVLELDNEVVKRRLAGLAQRQDCLRDVLTGAAGADEVR